MTIPMKNINRLKCLVLSILVMVGTLQSLFANNDQTGAQSSAKHIVFLISEDPLNYEADITIPPFAETLRTKFGFRVTVIQGSGTHTQYQFPQLETLEKADLLVVFCRRLALPFQQMEQIKNYIRSGKPVVGIRTANHGFSNWDEPVSGYEGWWGFVPDVLGCENKGYEPEELGVDVEIAANASNHEILKNINVTNWHSNGSLYKVGPLADKRAQVILNGKTKNMTDPVAWTRKTYHQGRVFYTSLGYPQDFEQEPFRKLLENGIHWALQVPVPAN
jgi:type 1 glutamine amidotransferase